MKLDQCQGQENGVENQGRHSGPRVQIQSVLHKCVESGDSRESEPLDLIRGELMVTDYAVWSRQRVDDDQTSYLHEA